jgi:hypothetical protein
MIGVALALAVAAAPAKPAPPRTGTQSTLIHSETFRRGEPASVFRVDYSVSANWSLAERKACFFNQCRSVCDETISKKTLSRQLWSLPPSGQPILVQDSPAQREYAHGVVTLERACAKVDDHEAARVVSQRLRPYQFADELIRDRPLLMKDADDYLTRLATGQ